MIENLETLLIKIEKCYKYKDYDTSVYLSAYLTAKNDEYELLYGIMLFYNQEYSRCLTILINNNTVTALYYKALCLYYLKQYAYAQTTIENLLKIDQEDEKTGCFFLDSFILELDKEFFYLLYAKILRQTGNIKEAIKYISLSFKHDILLPAVEMVYTNNVPYITNSKFEDPINQYYNDIYNLHSNYIKEYENYLPGYGSYYVAKASLWYLTHENQRVGFNLYTQLRKLDPTFIYNMDYFSTFLWKYKKENLCGLLAKEMIEINPNSEITWIVISNYYSLKNNVESCVNALEKANIIKETSLAYTLLGFEYNEKSQFSKSIAYFESALKMELDNSKALFGIGIAYDQMSKEKQAEKFLLKGLNLNNNNTSMQTYILRFYVKHEDYSKALKHFKIFMNFNDCDLKNIIDCILKEMDKYKDTEELMLLEFIEIINSMGYINESREILDRIKIRTSSYFDKKNFLETSGLI